MPPIPVVVVVEDETALGHVIRDVLTDEGYEVLPVRDQYAAVATLRSQKVDLVIADLPSPSDGQADPVAEIENDFPDVPLILLREQTPQDVPFFGPWRQRGSKVTLRRPFRLDDLLTVTRHILD
ncbi:MAG: response regulator [Gemmatimonadota bacterium]|nr:response regulator [Gemmatimonadota bacterium]